MRGAFEVVPPGPGLGDEAKSCSRREIIGVCPSGGAHVPRQGQAPVEGVAYRQIVDRSDGVTRLAGGLVAHAEDADEARVVAQRSTDSGGSVQ